uniref:Lysosomal-associated transmembrane protein 4A n=1 Tax=Hadrurus spadix TaxID=141984 RepID=A0A1W7RAB5_9SCOR
MPRTVHSAGMSAITKSLSLRNERFSCCLCCHVRTGTIILGIWHLILHLLALGLLFGVLFHSEAISNRLPSWAHSDETVDTPIYGQAVNGVFTPDIYSPQLPDLSAGPAANYAFGRENWQLEDVHVGIVITLCTGALTVLLLYGAIKGNPSYLMPFFCLQIVDFIISTLTAVGYFSYMPDVRRMIEDTTDLPFHKLLLCMDPQWLLAFLMIVVILCMMLKAYFMGVVWSCYKYLKMIQMSASLDSFLSTPDVEALLPPDYSTATKMPPHIPVYVPPPYTPSPGNQ